MKRIIMFFTIMSLFLNAAISQKKTYIGIEYGLKRDINFLSDPGGALQKYPFSTPQSGFIIGREIRRNWFLETGVSSHLGVSALQFKNSQLVTQANASQGFQIPMRVKYTIPLIENRLYVRPSLGILAGYRSLTWPYDGQEINLLSGSEYPKLEVAGRSPANKLFLAAEAGVDLSYTLNNHFDIVLGSRYTQGLVGNQSIDFNYQLEGADPQVANLKAGIGQLSVYTGVNFRIDNLIGEHGYLKSVRKSPVTQEELAKRSRFYVMSQMGFSWQSNQFHGDAAIMESRFKSPVISSKIKFGYRLKNNWILESGLAIHQLSYSYSIWDDQQHRRSQSGSISEGVVDYISIPIHLKHEFYSDNQRWILSPYAGISNWISTKTDGVGVPSLSTLHQNGDLVSTLERTHSIDNGYGLSIDFGASLEYRISNKLSFLLNGEYQQGLQKLSHINLLYQSGDQLSNGTVNNWGTGFNFSTGLKVRLW